MLCWTHLLRIGKECKFSQHQNHQSTAIWTDNHMFLPLCLCRRYWFVFMVYEQSHYWLALTRSSNFQFEARRWLYFSFSHNDTHSHSFPIRTGYTMKWMRMTTTSKCVVLACLVYVCTNMHTIQQFVDWANERLFVLRCMRILHVHVCMDLLYILSNGVCVFQLPCLRRSLLFNFLFFLRFFLSFSSNHRKKKTIFDTLVELCSRRKWGKKITLTFSFNDAATMCWLNISYDT